MVKIALVRKAKNFNNKRIHSKTYRKSASIVLRKRAGKRSAGGASVLRSEAQMHVDERIYGKRRAVVLWGKSSGEKKGAVSYCIKEHAFSRRNLTGKRKSETKKCRPQKGHGKKMESGSKKPYCRLIRQGHFSASCQMQERRNRKARTAGGRRRISEPARGGLFRISVDSDKKMCYAMIGKTNRHIFLPCP